MPRPRFENLPAERRRMIIDAAADEFAAHGFAAASLNRIIERAATSKGSIYYYFDNKEDLYLTVMHDAQERILNLMGGWRPAGSVADFWDEARRLFEHVLEFTCENPRIMALVRSYMQALSRGELTLAVERYKRPHFDFHRRFIADGQRVGAVRSDMPLELLVSLLHAIDDVGDMWIIQRIDDLDAAGRSLASRKFLMIYRRLLEPGPDTEEALR